MAMHYILPFNAIRIHDLDKVGGKNASLGEMIHHLHDLDVAVPDGFAVTANAYREFLQQAGLEEKIYSCLDSLNVDDINQLTTTGEKIRSWILAALFSNELQKEIQQAYDAITSKLEGDYSFAVRSSATAEDLPQASFAGQQETYLNVHGIENVLLAIKKVYASLFNDRAIAYRVHQGFDHRQVALSAGIQRMIRSDKAASGVMFTLDTESGFQEVVMINAAYGLGETVVQGQVNPDEYFVHKPTLQAGRPAVIRKHCGNKAIKMIYADPTNSNETVTTVAVELVDQQRYALTNEEITFLAKQALLIEQHYQRPMDIEWAKDGLDGKLYILQARPETVKSQQQGQHLERYLLKQKGKVLAQGRSVGQRIGSGKARVLKSLRQMDNINIGDVIVTDMTDPDWEPVMKRASAIVTNRGGRTCHAAIIARELGIPAVVGCGDATHTIPDGVAITVSCAEGDSGYIYSGILDFEIKSIDVNNRPQLPVKITMNVGNPERAFAFQAIPNDGIGLARLEFIISNTIGIHPKALLEFDNLPTELQQQIGAKTACYADPVTFYVEKLREGISTLAAAFHPKPVIVRLSDFKSNEYANLLGGDRYEPDEENPMLGFRGASRYISPDFRDCFALECEAVKRVRNEMGLTNLEIMIPFVRTVKEAEQVINVLAENGLKRGENGLRVIMMCEIPSNALLAEQFLEYFDGFSIGSNDLTQLTLGLDRDSALVAEQFDERNDAVKMLLAKAITACRQANKYIGICGQGPSDHPDLAAWLVQQGIGSLSLNPDSVLATMLSLAKLQ